MKNIANLIQIILTIQSHPIIQWCFLQGLRSNATDACEKNDPCQHGGICISTDSGPLCECRNLEYEGTYCERGKLFTLRSTLFPCTHPPATNILDTFANITVVNNFKVIPFSNQKKKKQISPEPFILCVEFSKVLLRFQYSNFVYRLRFMQKPNVN